MNLVGYDAISLGNHEFDYGIDRLYELAEMLNTKPVCANFKKIGEGECFEPYSIVSYGDVKIASTGNRLVRITETNLGNLIADAFRTVLGADIAYFNGGGIRSDMKAGVITYNDLLNVLPFNNTGVVVEVDGATVLKMLNAAVAKWPEENENFPHVSGVLFSANTQGDASSRVYNVNVLNPETGAYEPLELDKMYTVASNNFILLECGDGMTMFEGAKVVSDTGILDVEILERYIVNELGGVIDEKYARVSLHVVFTEGIQSDFSYLTDGNHAIVIGVVGLVLTIITIVTVLTIRKKRYGRGQSGFY